MSFSIGKLDTLIPGGVRAIWLRYVGKGPTKWVDEKVVAELSRLARDDVSASAWQKHRRTCGWKNTYRSAAQREAAQRYMEGPTVVGGMQGLSRRSR